MEVNIRLSTPELVALLRGLRIRTVMGLAVNPFDGLNETEIVDLIAKGLHRFCHLRKYGDPSDMTNPRLSEWGKVAAILTVSGLCTHSIVVSQTDVASQKKTWRAWHRQAQVEGTFVEYHKTDYDFHEFKALDTKEKLYAAVWPYLPRGLFPEGTKGVSEIKSKDLLEKRKFDLEDKNLLEAVIATGTWTTISCIRFEDGQHPDAISFLSTDTHAWMVSENPEKLFFIPCTLQSLKLSFVNLMSTFMS